MPAIVAGLWLLVQVRASVDGHTPGDWADTGGCHAHCSLVIVFSDLPQ
jgi:hypothetical protein